MLKGCSETSNQRVDTVIRDRIDRIRHLTGQGQGSTEFYEAASLAQSVVHDTVGGSHPIMVALETALKAADSMRARAASRGVVALYEEGALKSPRLAIAREIEGDILDIAQGQAEAAENATDPAHRQVHLGIAAFLAGASLEDALRRLCDARGLTYDAQRTSLSKLQAALYQPSKQRSRSRRTSTLLRGGTHEIRQIMVASARSRIPRSCRWSSVCAL